MKKISSTLACAAVMALSASVASAQLVINEIRIDQAGSDNDEYFELFGTPGTSLNTLTYLVIGDGTGGSGVIEAVVSLSGQSIPASGYWFAAENTFTLGGTPNLDVTGLNFENGDNVTHLLVDGFTGSNGLDLDTDDDGTFDSMPWSSIVDGVSLILQPNPPTTTEWAYAIGVGPDGAFVPGYIGRDAFGVWQIGPFDIAAGFDTPGAPNTIPEPSSFALAALGLLALAGRRK